MPTDHPIIRATDVGGTGFDLDRFVTAQDSGCTYATALAELRNGRKLTHWMWFVFPQIRGLGSSAAAWEYGLESLDEAVAYLRHPALGVRLAECVDVLLASSRPSAPEIFGSLDAMKLRSSMTLFATADPNDTRFQRVLEKYFNDRPDPATSELLLD